MKCPAEVYTASPRPYRGPPRAHLSAMTVTFSSPLAVASACIESASTPQPSWPDSASASRKSTMAFGSSASCTTISASSTWSKSPCSPWTTRSARGCYPCLRYGLSPMSQSRTGFELLWGSATSFTCFSRLPPESKTHASITSFFASSSSSTARWGVSQRAVSCSGVRALAGSHL